MAHKWKDLTDLTGDRTFRVERVRLEDSGVALEGDFRLPPLARLSAEDQAFASAFLASHGSIKKMEALFGISYPTVKNRLNSIAGKIDAPRVQVVREHNSDKRADILDRLDKGEIDFQTAMEELS